MANNLVLDTPSRFAPPSSPAQTGRGFGGVMLGLSRRF